MTRCPGIVERLVPGVNRRWDEGSAALRQHVLRYRLAAAWVRPGDRVLDAACGAGYGAWVLARAGARVTAVDRCKETLRAARAEYAHDRIEWQCLDLDGESPVLGKFERIVSLETIEHVQDPRKLLVRFLSSLKPTGILIVSTPVVPTRHIDPYHLHEWSETEFLTLLRSAAFSTVDRLIQEETFATVVAAAGPEPDLEPRPLVR